MMQLSMEETPPQLRELIKMAMQGEDIVITQSGKPIIKWVTIPPKKRRRAGSIQHMDVYMADDFDEPLEDFAEYM